MIPIFDAFQNSHSFLTSFEKLQIVLKFFLEFLLRLTGNFGRLD